MKSQKTDPWEQFRIASAKSYFGDRCKSRLVSMLPWLSAYCKFPCEDSPARGAEIVVPRIMKMAQWWRPCTATSFPLLASLSTWVARACGPFVSSSWWCSRAILASPPSSIRFLTGVVNTFVGATRGPRTSANVTVMEH